MPELWRFEREKGGWELQEIVVEKVEKEIVVEKIALGFPSSLSYLNHPSSGIN